MFICTSAALAAVVLLAGHAVAKTDIAGCVSSQTVAYGGASLIWYVPDTGEICAFLDCGGGLAPPKTTVPGCPEYKGTATYSPSYLPGFGSATTSTTSSPLSSEVTATGSSASKDSSSSDKSTITSPPATTITGTVTSSGSVQTQTGSDSAAALSSSSSSAASSVSTGGAASPTGLIKGAFGVVAGMAAGVALL